MNTSPPAVAIGPPMFGAPVLGIPFAVSSSNSPRGTRHAISPVLTLTALSSPHGGCWHGKPVFRSMNRLESAPQAGIARRHAHIVGSVLALDHLVQVSQTLHIDEHQA